MMSIFRTRRVIFTVLAIAAGAASLGWGGNRADAGSPVLGLDHLVLAVSDLDAAAERYRELGFALKPGRPHENGIQNVHVKFPNGTEIELLTAPESRDAMTGEYREHLAGGDGAAFLALYAPAVDRLTARLSEGALEFERGGGVVSFPLKHPLRHVFFGRRNRSPTDQPEHFAHPNTAASLVAVWLSAENFDHERSLFALLGYETESDTVSTPDPIPSEVVEIGEGEVYFLPGARQIVPGRRIVGATVSVGNLAAAKNLLQQAGVEMIVATEDTGIRSVFLPPSVTHGVWLELREVR
jgi:catechol 2,3-dioxygenase-like lactoylglutathione lyase family enzyme